MTINSVSFAVASKVVKNFSMEVTRVRGYFNGSTDDRWLLLYDAKSVAEIAGAPTRAYPLFQAAPFDVMVEDAPVSFVNGCVAVVSSTAATYTANADTMDLFVSGSSPYDDTGWTVVGNVTAADNNVELLATGNLVRMTRVRITDVDTNGPFYVAVLTAAELTALTAGDALPSNRVYRVEAGESIDLFAGDGIPMDGIGFAVSSTAGVYTATTDCACEVSYKA